MSQREIRVQKLYVDDTLGNENSHFDATAAAVSLRVLTVDLDFTAGDYTAQTTLYANSLILGGTLIFSEGLAGGTSVKIGDGTDGDGFLTYSSATSNVGDIVLVNGALLNTVNWDGEISVDITGTYTAGAGTLKLVYLDPGAGVDITY